MSRKKILIPKKVLTDLYWKKNYSPEKIGIQYSCTQITVRNRLKELSIPLKTPAFARTRSFRRNFSGDDATKAYIIGFRLGDLNVYAPSKFSETVVVRCHSTVEEQIRLTKELFKTYGRITISLAANGKNRHINCFLNNSFEFLLPKYTQPIRQWVWSTEERGWAFTAGYIDAEGSFKLNQGRARFKLDSYDTTAVRDIYRFLCNHSIRAKRRCIQRLGSKRKDGTSWSHDLWRLNVNEALSLETFITILRPFLRHRHRIQDAEHMLKNIEERRKKKHAKHT